VKCVFTWPGSWRGPKSNLILIKRNQRRRIVVVMEIITVPFYELKILKTMRGVLSSDN